MCGIGCVKVKILSEKSLAKVKTMIIKTNSRGEDAFGIIIVKKNGHSITYKVPISIVEACQLQPWKDVFGLIEEGDFIMWNCRAQPLTEITSDNDDLTIQPIHRDGFIVSHNGVVSNDKELIKDEELEPETKIDSEIPFLLYKKYGSVKEAFSKCSGGFAYLMYNIAADRLDIIKDFKTLVYGESEELIFVVSEESFIKDMFNTFVWREVPPYTNITIDFKNNVSTKESIKTKITSSLPDVDDNKILVCASGGIDSTTAAYIAKNLWGMEVFLCHINHGQKSEYGEQKAFRGIAKELGAETIILDATWLGDLGASVLTDSKIEVPKANHQNLKSTVCWTPARNLTMIAMLVSIAEAYGIKWITAGWTLEEEGSYPDNSIMFFKKFNELTEYGTLSRPKLIMPLERLMKTEIIQLGSDLGVPYELTYSCDNEPKNGIACGMCGACTLRRMAFEKAGIEDKTKYKSDWKEQYVPPWLNDKMRPPRHSVEAIKNRIIAPKSTEKDYKICISNHYLI